MQTERSWQVRALHTMAATVLAIGLAACGGGGGEGEDGDQPGAGKPPVTLGSKNFTEQFVLGQLYKQALEAKGYRVTLRANIGSSELTDRAMVSGRIDGYPEYTGTILSTIAQREQRPTSARQAYREAKRFEERRGFTLTEPTPFFNTDALAVLRQYGRDNNLRGIADLRRLGARVTLGAPPESRTRFEGLVGLRSEYGLTQMKFRPLAIGLQYGALDRGQIQVADVFTTDGQLNGNKYRVLRDPEKVFGFQNVAMVISRRVLRRQGPEFEETINAVSEKLTTEAMRQMNAAADLDKVPPAQVARRFLKANDLL